MTAAVARWLPPLLWMGLIFYGSTDVLSAAHTGGFIEPLIHRLFPSMSQPAVDQLHFVIRKGAHITEYALLASLLWRAIRNPAAGHADPPADRRAALFAWAIAAAYAASDEFHQSFVPSRGASVEDVMIDACGAFCGLALICAWRARRRANPPAAPAQP